MDVGYWMLDVRSGILDIGYWILDIGYWILDFGYWILDIGSRKIQIFNLICFSWMLEKLQKSKIFYFSASGILDIGYWGCVMGVLSFG